MTDVIRTRLDGELTIYTAQQVRETLAEMLRACAEATGVQLLVDLSAVSDTDSAGMQLLLGARRQAEAAGHTLAFVDCSDSLREAGTLLGLGDWLDGKPASAADL